MANKKISELPYINGSKISGNTLVPLVTYFSASTGDTVHTYITDLQNYLTSGITASGNYLPLSGGTVSGGTKFTAGLTANTISATTYQNLPASTFSGGTVTGPTIFTNGLSATTISATTYQNLPTDIRVTGGTYSAGTTTFRNNTGGTFNVTGFFTGGTDVRVTGGTYSAGTITFTNNTGGTFNVTGLTTGSTSTVSGNFLPLSGGTVTGGTVFTSGVTASTLNISSTPTTDTGTTANYLTRDGSTGEIKVKTIPEPTVYGLFSQTGTSVAVSATTVESTLINAGIGTITVPANGFQVGDSFNGVLIGHLSCVGTATLQIRIKTTTGVLFADTGAIAMNTATNKHWKLDVNFTIRQLGVASVGSIASGGLFSYTKNSGTNFEGTNFSIINNTTFDTTISNTLLVTAEWNTNNAGNLIYSEIFTLNKTY